MNKYYTSFGRVEHTFAPKTTTFWVQKCDTSHIFNVQGAKKAP